MSDERGSGRWAGVDVGAGKGFDLAVVSTAGVISGPVRVKTASEAVDWLRESSPRVVAVDSPRSTAPNGLRSRHCEREFASAGVCGIRYTPDLGAIRSHPTGYYDWILNGLRLYSCLERAAPEVGWRIIECFPTASWTRLGERRRSRRRAEWSRKVLRQLDLAGLPARMSQDARDAVVAAYTARLHDEGRTESFGEVVIPLG